VKYIKVPVYAGQLTSSIWEGDDLLCAVGCGRAVDYKKRDELMTVLNVHDALVSERDELKAQRDALVEALNMAGVYLGLWPPVAKSMQARHHAELSEKITDTLALVKEK